MPTPADDWNVRFGTATRSCLAIIAFTAFGCGTSAPTAVTREIEAQAVLDAVHRFVRDRNTDVLVVEPTEHLPADLSTIEDTRIEFLTWQELVDRHRGERIAPARASVRIYRYGPDPPGRFHVAISSGAKNTGGFDSRPYWTGVNYEYSVEDGVLKMVAEDVEVE